jgi:hypothetical protein
MGVTQQSEPVRVKITLRLMVSQSVCLRVEPHLGLITRYKLLFHSYCLVLWRGPSLTRGRVCSMSESVSSTTSTVIMYKYFTFYIFDMVLIYIQYVQGLRQSGLGTADYALLWCNATSNRVDLYSLHATRTENSVLVLEHDYRIIA